MNDKITKYDFAYVPSNGKIPIYAWVDDCPDGIDPRSLDNPLTASYEETVSERINDGLKDRFDWGGDWIIVGSADPNDRFVDYDADLRNHDEILDDPGKISFAQMYTTVFTSKNGIHGIQFFTGMAARWVDTLDAKTPPGLDIQGDSSNKLGVVGSPWHQIDYELKHTGVKLPVPDDRTSLFSYDGRPILVPGDDGPRRRTPKHVEYDGPIHTADVFPDLPIEENCPHPVHGSSEGSNFKIDTEGTFACWSSRHDRWPIVGTPYHAIGMREGILDCGEWSHMGDYNGKRDEIRMYCKQHDIDIPRDWVEITFADASATAVTGGAHAKLF